MLCTHNTNFEELAAIIRRVRPKCDLEGHREDPRHLNLEQLVDHYSQFLQEMRESNTGGEDGFKAVAEWTQMET